MNIDGLDFHNIMLHQFFINMHINHELIQYYVIIFYNELDESNFRLILKNNYIMIELRRIH